MTLLTLILILMVRPGLPDPNIGSGAGGDLIHKTTIEVSRPARPWRN